MVKQAVLVSLMLLFLSFVVGEAGPDRYLMLEFLRSQHVEEIGLLRASTTAYPDNITIYIANDNLLASRALAVLGDRELSSKILTKLNNEYQGGFNGKVDILLGVDIPDVFYVSEIEPVGEVNGYRIVYEKPGDRVIEDWYEYADLLVYRALDRLLCGSRRHAELLFLNLTRMWDGYGFRDKAFNSTGVYATYKCALFIYLYRSLDASGSDVVKDYAHVRSKCYEIITLAQDPLIGGIRTDYRVINGRIISEGDVNVETTSMTVIALFSDYPSIIAGESRDAQYTSNTREHSIVLVILGVVIVIILVVLTFLIEKIKLCADNPT